MYARAGVENPFDLVRVHSKTIKILHELSDNVHEHLRVHSTLRYSNTQCTVYIIIIIYTPYGNTPCIIMHNYYIKYLLYIIIIIYILFVEIS